MNIKVKFILSIFIFSWLLTNTITGQSIDNKTYDIEQKKLEYDKKKEVWKPKKSEKKKREIINPNFPNISFDGIISILGYLLLGAFLIFVIYKLVELKSDNKKIDGQEVNLDDIEDIKEVNFDDLLKEALRNKDFRLAVRIQYLQLIQAFTNKEVLVWKPHKTNRTFIEEMNGHTHQTSFSKLSNIFEYIWYGVTDVSDDNYESISSQFSSLLNKINNEE